MKVLYLINKGLMTPDLAISLILYGFDVITIENYEFTYDIEAPGCRQKIEEYIDKDNYDFVISYNFIPSAAYVCQKHNLIYVSWMYDAFFPILYTNSLYFSCNRIFVFDSKEYAYLKGLGISNAFYLPLCVNNNRLSELIISDEDVRNYSCDISMVGKLYCSDGVNGYNQIKPLLDSDLSYDIDAILKSISCDWSDNIDILSSFSTIDFNKMPKLMSNEEPRDKFILQDNLYYLITCFSRALAQIERTNIINSLANNFNTCIYTFERPVGLSNKVTVHDGVDYITTMPKIFNLSKINLNITLRSIIAGIPLRVFDIMGAGGFLMTNHQKDLDKFFLDGIDYVSFNSMDDLMQKTDYYLSHESERIQIAINGYNKTCTYHTYENRLDEMLNILLKTGLVIKD